MKFSVVSLFCLISLSCLSQSQVWKTGKIVSSDGDTVKVEILFEDWNKSPAEITYRSSGLRSTANASNSRGFIIDAPYEAYVVKTAELKYYLKVAVAIGADPVEKVVTATLFFELVHQLDDIKLYRIVDEDNETRFFLERAGTLRELHNISYLIGEYSEKRVERRVYREELKAVLNDCETLKTNNLAYSERDIVGLLEDYAICKGVDKAEFAKDLQRPKLNLGVSVGIPFIAYSNSVTYALAGEIVSPRRFGRFSAIVELGVLSKSYKPIPTNVPGRTFVPNSERKPYVGLFGSIKLINAPVSPVINFGFMSHSTLVVGAGIAHRSGTALMLHHGLVRGPESYDSGSARFATVQLRVMIPTIKSN